MQTHTDTAVQVINSTLLALTPCSLLTVLFSAMMSHVGEDPGMISWWLPAPYHPVFCD